MRLNYYLIIFALISVFSIVLMMTAVFTGYETAPVCNVDTLCNEINGETVTNCPDDCSLSSYEQDFCNTADYKSFQVIGSSFSPESFVDSFSLSHKFFIKLFSPSTKKVLAAYDNADYELLVNSPRRMISSEAIITRVSLAKSGSYTAHICIKVKTPPPFCNDNICNFYAAEGAGCPRDCAIEGAEKDFCNSADFNLGALLQVGSYKFLDKQNKQHQFLIQSINMNAKIAQITYDGSQLTVPIHDHRIFPDYEVLIPQMGFDSTGKEFAHFCIKAKQVPACDFDNLCEDLNENEQNCPSDCSYGSHQSFCSTADLNKKITLGSSETIRDSQGNNHDLKLTNLDFVSSPKKIIFSYDQKESGVDLEHSASSDFFEIHVPIAGIDQANNKYAVLCLKTKQPQTTQESTTCVGEGGSLGAVVPENNLECCQGLQPFIPSGITGSRGTCVSITQIITDQTQVLTGVCNKNKICDEHLGEDGINCMDDCIISQEDLSFCSNADLFGIIPNIPVGVQQIRWDEEFRDSFASINKILLIDFDDVLAKLKIIYNNEEIELIKGEKKETDNYKIIMPLMIGKRHPIIPQQSYLLSGLFCIKQKKKYTPQPLPPLPDEKKTDQQPPIVQPPIRQKPQLPPSGLPKQPGTQPGDRPGDFFKITAVIKDSKTNKTLENAKIDIFPYIKFSDGSGEAVFEKIPKGSINYKIELREYRSFESSIELNRNLRLIIPLEPTGEAKVSTGKKILQKAQIIVGQKADPSDVFTAELIKKSLSQNIVVEQNGEVMLQVGTIPSDERVESEIILDKDAKLFTPKTNSIIVGGACSNKQAYSLLGNPEDCTVGLVDGQAKISLETTGGTNVIILVYGYSKEDTRMAATALVKGLLQPVIGKEFLISQRFGEIRVDKMS